MLWFCKISEDLAAFAREWRAQNSALIQDYVSQRTSRFNVDERLISTVFRFNA